MPKNYKPLLMFFFVITLSFMTAFAQGSNQMMSGMHGENSAMCGAMGWGGMLLGGLLTISAIAALVSLSIFLVRRSRH